MLRSKALAPLLLATALNSPTTQALQLVEARDGVTAEATISIKEATRIKIDGAPITDVIGNIFSSNCGAGGEATAAPNTPQTNPSGEVVLECDRDKGEIYVRPVNGHGKPVNLFISSAAATYTLMLRRADTPADTIVIRDKTPRQAGAGADRLGEKGPAGRSSNHIRALKAMLVAMSSDRVPTDIRVEEVNRPVQLWAEASFSLMRVFEGRGIIGEKYMLTNISDEPMVLAEQEFDRENANVTAIAIERHTLAPGDSTSVYILRHED